MEAQPSVVTVRFNKFLPYWAVLQTDIRQTFRSWVYRLWVVVTLIAATGFILYRVGAHREAGLTQSAAGQCGELLRLVVVGSMAVVVILAVSAVGSERGTVADSVLSRGISRHQYFLAKWHARLVVVTSTFGVLSIAMFLASYLLFRADSECDLSLLGILVAVVAICTVLGAIVSWGVTIGSLTNGTVLGITIFWIILYGSGFLLTLLPDSYPSPDRELARLKYVLMGQFSSNLLSNIILGGLAASGMAALVGIVGFSRKDV